MVRAQPRTAIWLLSCMSFGLAVATLIWTYRDSLWWPSVMSDPGLEVHAWHGRVYIAHYLPQRVPPGCFMEIQIFDSASGPMHPTPRRDALIEGYVKNNLSYSSMQADVVVARPALLNGYGFFRTRRSTPDWSVAVVGFPLWPLVFLTGVFFARVSWRQIFHPVPEGICRRCGYDLRATPMQCPECGRKQTGTAAD